MDETIEGTQARVDETARMLYAQRMSHWIDAAEGHRELTAAQAYRDAITLEDARVVLGDD